MKVERQVMAANRRQRDQTGQSDQELDTIEAIRDYRTGKADAKPKDLIVFNRNNLAQYFRPGDSKYVTMEAAGRLPSSNLLTLERARGVGNVLGMDLADHMSAQGVPGADNLTQNNNMMAGIGAAKAADQKHFVEQGYQGKLTSSTNPAKVAQAQQKVADGEQSRMAALGEIFMTLRSALERKDLGMGVAIVSVESATDTLGTTVFDVLAQEIPCVSIDTILGNESRFEEMPELVFLAALAVRHAPTDRVVAIVKRLLTAPNEAARVSAADAAVLLNGGELVSAVKAAGAREDLSLAARRVFQTSIRDKETHVAAWNRDKPFADPEEVFHVRW